MALFVGAVVRAHRARTALPPRCSATKPTPTGLRWRLLLERAARCARPAPGALSGWLFFTRGLGIQQTGLILVVYTFCVAAVPVLANQPRMFLAFVGAVLRAADRAHRHAAATPTATSWPAMLLIIITLTTVLARNYRQALQRVIELKLRADELLVQLRVEKQAAEAARHEAEVANRAKTQFFAAASHDLRQPLHAMGLFAEALRQRSARARGGAARQQHQRLGRRARRPVLRAARHHPHRHRRRRGASAALRGRRHPAQAAPALRADRVREGPGAAPARRRHAWCTPTRCWSSASCATWSATRSATPTTAACWSAARRRGDQRAAAGLGHRPGHPRRASRPRIFEEFYQVPQHAGGRRRTSARAWVWGWRSSSAWPT